MRGIEAGMADRELQKPARPEDAERLGEGPVRLGYVHEAHEAGGEVEGLIGDTSGARCWPRGTRSPGVVGLGLPGTGDEGLGDVDGRERAPPGEQPGVVALAASRCRGPEARRPAAGRRRLGVEVIPVDVVSRPRSFVQTLALPFQNRPASCGPSSISPGRVGSEVPPVIPPAILPDPPRSVTGSCQISGFCSDGEEPSPRC